MHLPSSPTNLVTTSVHYYTGTEWHFLSPINTALSVYIIFQNSIIIYHYHRDWERISSFLFMLIAAVDIGNACSELGRNTLELLCLENSSIRLQSWGFVVLVLIGELCYVISSYLNLVLTVVKTINIVNPFYRLNSRAIYISLCSIIIIYFALFISDIIYVICERLNQNPMKCTTYRGLFHELDTLDILGEVMLIYYLNNGQLYSHFSAVLIVIQLCLPGIIVLVCAVLQMFYIKKAFSRSENQVVNTANHANLTVFMISLLYVCSVSVYSYRMLVQHIQILIHNAYTPFDYRLLSFGKYTLPLVNAALFLTILTLRKPDLRAQFRNYIVKMLLLPLTIFGKVRSLFPRRSGYIQI